MAIPTARLAFMKLHTGDLEAATAFWQAAFGFADVGDWYTIALQALSGFAFYGSPVMVSELPEKATPGPVLRYLPSIRSVGTENDSELRATACPPW